MVKIEENKEIMENNQNNNVLEKNSTESLVKDDIKTKVNKKNKKGKHKATQTLGDIVFKVLVIVAIFFIVVIAYTFYIKGIQSEKDINNYVTQNIIRNINKTN